MHEQQPPLPPSEEPAVDSSAPGVSSAVGLGLQLSWLIGRVAALERKVDALYQERGHE